MKKKYENEILIKWNISSLELYALDIETLNKKESQWMKKISLQLSMTNWMVLNISTDGNLFNTKFNDRSIYMYILI